MSHVACCTSLAQSFQTKKKHSWEEQNDAQEAIVMAFMDLQERMSVVSDCQEVVDVKCRFLKDSGAKFNKENRRAEDAQVASCPRRTGPPKKISTKAWVVWTSSHGIR